MDKKRIIEVKGIEYSIREKYVQGRQGSSSIVRSFFHMEKSLSGKHLILGPHTKKTSLNNRLRPDSTRLESRMAIDGNFQRDFCRENFRLLFIARLRVFLPSNRSVGFVLFKPYKSR